MLTIRLDRPQTRNALDGATVSELIDAIEAAQTDRNLRAIVLTGAGETFSAGADLRAFQSSGSPLEGALERRALGRLLLLLEDLTTPTIARVNGDAFGAGFGLVAACDLAVAVTGARLGLPGVRLGILPMTIMPAVFRSLGRKLGLELMLTGRLISPRRRGRQGC